MDCKLIPPDLKDFESIDADPMESRRRTTRVREERRSARHWTWKSKSPAIATSLWAPAAWAATMASTLGPVAGLFQRRRRRVPLWLRNLRFATLVAQFGLHPRDEPLISEVNLSAQPRPDRLSSPTSRYEPPVGVPGLALGVARRVCPLALRSLHRGERRVPCRALHDRLAGLHGRGSRGPCGDLRKVPAQGHRAGTMGTNPLGRWLAFHSLESRI